MINTYVHNALAQETLEVASDTASELRFDFTIRMQLYSVI